MSETRKDQMQEQFDNFHEAHPEVYQMFVQFSISMINRGYASYSTNSIIERIRWEKDVGGDGVNQFKINNNHAPFYSRKFMEQYPQYDGFFRTRKQTSEKHDACRLPELTPQDYEYVR